MKNEKLQQLLIEQALTLDPDMEVLDENIATDFLKKALGTLWENHPVATVVGASLISIFTIFKIRKSLSEYKKQSHLNYCNNLTDSDLAKLKFCKYKDGFLPIIEDHANYCNKIFGKRISAVEKLYKSMWNCPKSWNQITDSDIESWAKMAQIAYGGLPDDIKLVKAKKSEAQEKINNLDWKTDINEFKILYKKYEKIIETYEIEYTDKLYLCTDQDDAWDSIKFLWDGYESAECKNDATEAISDAITNLYIKIIQKVFSIIDFNYNSSELWDWMIFPNPQLYVQFKGSKPKNN